MEPILSMDNISKVYPGVKALDSVSVDFYPGEVHALLGQNGAGKSTLIKMITGADQPTNGTIKYDGNVYKKMEPQKAIDMGISAVYQEFNLAPNLSIAENIFIGNYCGKNFMINRKQMNEKARELFRRFNIEIDPNTLISSLSPAYQQLVEIIKAVSRNTKLLIMDEPTAPLTVSEVDILMEIIKKLREEGISIIYITHRIEELFRISDKVTIMRDGQYICTKQTNEITRKELISLMVGVSFNEYYPEGNYSTDEVVLDVKDLCGNGLKDISFQLHKGEVLGFGGLVGCGRTETMDVIYGSKPMTSGSITINGKPYKPKAPLQAINRGIGYVPEDRKNNGLVMFSSINENISLSIFKRISKGVVVDSKKQQSIANSYMEKLAIKAPNIDELCRNLSGGNQQKTIIAKWLAAESSILIMDEPTRGIDVSAKAEIYSLIREYTKNGGSVLFITSDMEELIGMSDRIVVLSEKHLSGVLEKEEFDKNRILEMTSVTHYKKETA